MNTITAPSPTTPTDNLHQALHATTDTLSQTDPATTTTEDTRTALAVAHETVQELSRWQSVVTSARDEHVLRLWQKGQSQAEIADFLGVSKLAVRTILTERLAQATPAERAEYERRASEEFEAEVFAESGNLFSAEEVSAV